MMVAAHPWDLRAAAEHGMATAFIARPEADPPRADDDFDLTVTDLTELADRLGLGEPALPEPNGRLTTVVEGAVAQPVRAGDS